MLSRTDHYHYCDPLTPSQPMAHLIPSNLQGPHSSHSWEGQCEKRNGRSSAALIVAYDHQPHGSVAHNAQTVHLY